MGKMFTAQESSCYVKLMGTTLAWS